MASTDTDPNRCRSRVCGDLDEPDNLDLTSQMKSSSRELDVIPIGERTVCNLNRICSYFYDVLSPQNFSMRHTL